MKLKLLFLSFFIGVTLYAQQKLKNDPSNKKLIKNIATSLADKEYKKSIEFIEKINPNDSIYNDLLITKSYAYLKLEKYDQSIKIIEEALLLENQKSRYPLLLNKGINLERLGKLEEAINHYTKTIEEFPRASALFFNRALVRMKKENWNTAYTDLEKSLLYGPFSKSTHYKIGEIYYLENQLSQALMALTMYLLINPDGEDSFKTLEAINTSFSRKNKSEPRNIVYTKDDKSFKTLDLILSNGVALNPKYKIDNKIKTPLVKQLTVLFEQLDTYKGNGGFWDKKMVLFFKWIKSSGNFDNFIYTICYSIENPSYKKVIKKNTSKIIPFIGEAIAKWEEIIATDNSENFEGKQQLVNYVYNQKKLVAKGKVKAKNKIGVWNIYDEDGKIFF